MLHLQTVSLLYTIRVVSIEDYGSSMGRLLVQDGLFVQIVD